MAGTQPEKSSRKGKAPSAKRIFHVQPDNGEGQCKAPRPVDDRWHCDRNRCPWYRANRESRQVHVHRKGFVGTAKGIGDLRCLANGDKGACFEAPPPGFQYFVQA